MVGLKIHPMTEGRCSRGRGSTSQQLQVKVESFDPLRKLNVGQYQDILNNGSVGRKATKDLKPSLSFKM